MVAMWDEVFGISGVIEAGDGPGAFEAGHAVLDAAWAECFRVLIPGGLCCINIGDATRSVGGEFGLWPNHARILRACMDLGFTVLPDILWRKPNNSPTKFMGSGMLPAGAYVTYEHEYVLVLRKGGRRRFKASERANRRASAVFWEERNAWYSDLWDLKGTGQKLGRSRERSAAFPFELAYRLICMHSVYGDVVLDPFAGTGTTLHAAATAGRSSVGIDTDADLVSGFSLQADFERVRERLSAHRAFVEGRECKHENALYGPVVTSQERDLELRLGAVSGDLVEYEVLE